MRTHTSILAMIICFFCRQIKWTQLFLTRIFSALPNITQLRLARRQAVITFAVIMMLANSRTGGQTPKPEDLISLVPSVAELRGFVRFSNGELMSRFVQIEPEKEFADLNFMGRDHVLTDTILFNEDEPPRNGEKIKTHEGGRVFYTEDMDYRLILSVKMCSSAVDSKTVSIHRYGAAVPIHGHVAGLGEIGTASLYTDGFHPSMSFYQEQLSAFIVGNKSRIGSRKNDIPGFPLESLDSIAYLILLKGARQPDLTGIVSRPANITVNDQPITTGKPIVMGKTIYVPAVDLAIKAGFTVNWDESTGKLVITGKAGSTTFLAGYNKVATASGKVVKLSIPVLKEGGLPVMSLIDLVDVLGGTVSNDGITYAVKF
ncbi:MAG: copper amine oxidase N-terminal domain-containing protein [Chthonomonadales bacterium]